VRWRWPWREEEPTSGAEKGGSSVSPLPEGPEDEILRAALAEVVDPELGLDILSLGIVRHARRVGAQAWVVLAPTSPACPVGPWMAEEARRVLLTRFPALGPVHVSLSWDPPWSVEDLSPAARAALGVG